MRYIDFVFSLALIIILMPLFILLSIIVFIGEPFKPIIYKGVRVGYKGKKFIMYKFRTLKVNAEEIVGKKLLKSSMSLKTPIGKILRYTKLDELPQLFNVLKGDMSFIGPRPDRPIRYYENIRTIKGYAKRLNVLPGMSGIAQVKGNYFTHPAIKLSYDLQWISNRNLFVYFLYIVETVFMIGKQLAVKFIPATRLAPWVSVALLITSISRLSF